MYARKNVDGMLGDCLSRLHAQLAEALKAAVDAARRGGRLSLSQLARSMASVTAIRHRIKRMDRLLGNTARSAREPWLLACSTGLASMSPEETVSVYAKRMRIEQSFRDLKNERLGLALARRARARASALRFCC